MRPSLTDSLRLGLLGLTWLAAVLQILFGESVLALTHLGVVLLAVYFLLTLPRLKRESFQLKYTLIILISSARMSNVSSMNEMPILLKSLVGAVRSL